VTEEINVLTPAEQKGANLGWSVYEGTACCMTQGDRCTQGGQQAACNTAGIVMPKDARTHGAGWLAIIGGQVYRGSCYPGMEGWYFYTDNSRGRLVRAKLQTDGTLMTEELVGTFPGSPASIHADSRGELYLTTSSTPGRIYHLEATP
ncbi:MAG: hypothetical protein JNL83_15685, partial [Myxococcales bacterium]|nr:hypothetical protein [Myxococcales bacterium]